MNTTAISAYSGISNAPISTTNGMERMYTPTIAPIPTRSTKRPTMRLPAAPPPWISDPATTACARGTPLLSRTVGSQLVRKKWPMRLVTNAVQRRDVIQARPSVNRCRTGIPNSALCSAATKRVAGVNVRSGLNLLRIEAISRSLPPRSTRKRAELGHDGGAILRPSASETPPPRRMRSATRTG